jgi:hypothetical protein
MAIDIRRRQFISVLGGAVVAWPLAARAQQPGMPVVGFIHVLSFDNVPHYVPAFRQGLKETGSLRAKTWPSNTAGRRANTADHPSWQPIWYAERSP